MRQLETAAQDIIGNRDFALIQADIEEVAATGADAWYAGKIRKTPVAAAFAHLIGARAIKNAETDNLSDIPTDLPIYEQYRARTAKRDEIAGGQIMDEYQDSPTLSAAFDYFCSHIELIRKFEGDNPTTNKASGKSTNGFKPKRSAYYASNSECRRQYPGSYSARGPTNILSSGRPARKRRISPATYRQYRTIFAHNYPAIPNF